MADSRLSDIYRNELKAKGLLGALVSASGARLKEKTDIRGMLPQTGVSGAAFEKLFGKAYKYGGNKQAVRSSGGSDGGVSKSMEEKLTRIGVDGKLTAKNTVVLPAMARDMNLMRMNMQKMVRLSGGTPSTKSDMFFKRASDREAQYEGQYKRNSGGLAPTPVGGKKEEGGGGFLSTILGFFKGGIGNIVETLLGVLIKGGLIAGFLVALGKYFNEKEFRDSVNSMLDTIFKTVFGDDYKKNLATGAAILAGAYVAFKASLALLEAAIFAAARRIAMLGGPGLPGGPGDPDKGKSKGKGGFSKNLGKFGLYGMGAYGMYEGYNAMFGDNGIVSDESLNSSNGDINEYSIDKKNLGLNTDTALAVGGTALGAYGLASAGSSLKKSLTPKAPTATPATKPGFLMTAEDKIQTRASTQAKASSKWGRFLAFVAKKSPTLFARLGIKLTAMAGMATIPIAGWISALFTLGFAAFDIYAIYTLWSEFTGTDEETANPNVNDAKSEALKATNATPVAADTTNVSPTPTSFNAAKDSQAASAAMSTSGSTSPTNARNSNLLDIIAGGESGSMGYDAANKGKAGDMPGGYPGLSKMTVNDVMRLQSQGKVFATGRYQIIPTTLAGLMSGKYGNIDVKGSDLYDASTQDKLGTALINKRLKQGGSDPIKQQLALSQEFASIANPSTGSSYYDKIGNNKASIGTATIQSALAGTTLASASTTVADGRRAALQAGGGTIINSPTTNTTVASGGGSNSGGGVKLYNDALRVDALRMVI